MDRRGGAREWYAEMENAIGAWNLLDSRDNASRPVRYTSEGDL